MAQIAPLHTKLHSPCLSLLYSAPLDERVNGYKSLPRSAAQKDVRRPRKKVAHYYNAWRAIRVHHSAAAQRVYQHPTFGVRAPALLPAWSDHSDTSQQHYSFFLAHHCTTRGCG